MNHTTFHAEEYDKKIKQTLPYYQDFYEQVTDILDVMGKVKVCWLDIGCGTGKMYEAAQRRAPIQEFVFADISEKMLELSKSRFRAEGNQFKIRRNGVFFTFENIRPNSEVGKQIALQRWTKYQIEHGKSQKEADEHKKRYERGYYPIRIESHLEMMRRCGFQSVELIWMSYMQAGFMGIKGGN
ncbi:MAG: class I SAM-dependent methyltransferase [Lachnospiraceae bacterium]|nr:class I SAM-dependent methyltransferase [Lachnospiraceae bacterium]